MSIPHKTWPGLPQRSNGFFRFHRISHNPANKQTDADEYITSLVEAKGCKCF